MAKEESPPLGVGFFNHFFKMDKKPKKPYIFNYTRPLETAYTG